MLAANTQSRSLLNSKIIAPGAHFSRNWGDGTTSSSDRMCMSIGVKASNAEYNARHFGAGRGTNIYAHAADIWVPFGKPQVIGTN